MVGTDTAHLRRDDLRMSVIARLRNTHWCDFEVYAIAGTDGDTALYMDEDAQIVFDIAEAHPFMTGFIKWDGCGEWEMEEHFCGRADMQRLSGLIDFLYDTARDMIPAFDEELAR